MLPTVQKSDLIYICSPAKSIDQESIQSAVHFFETNDYRVEVSENALGTNHYFSGTIEQRLKDLQKGLDHPEAKVILCSRGGYGCIQLLEKLDWSSFQKQPKWIVGFSDITVLHLACSKLNIPSLHATMPLNFLVNTKKSLKSLLAAVSNSAYDVLAPYHPNNNLGTVEGQLIGGNLAIVHAMLTYCGVAIFAGKILFLEDVGEHLYKVDRMLFGLQFAGIFDSVTGLILGGFSSMSDTDTPFGESLESIFRGHFRDQNKPLAFDFPAGHQNDNQAIVFGKTAKLSVTAFGSTLEVLENRKESSYL